ncbi:cupin domain-containing protein [Dickeya dianthicola]|uniref:cupin domain-containing protein n=1 Tax=Dickeya dianthicola TaxID=204039 RepID=UPI00186916FB|nr:cupin domain-containing protein [Dickeya dianthicola]QOL13493.1 cupin domain-containing protein [Dickeya dianthicola]
MSDAIDLGKTVSVADSVIKFRRVVSDTDLRGKSFFAADDVCSNVQSVMGMPEFATTELWRTEHTPVDLVSETVDPTAGPVILNPPANGSVFRVVEFPPDSLVVASLPGKQVSDMMHRTSSIDYAYVIEGEIFAVLDEDEKRLCQGDVMIQRGTAHGWSNRSGKPSLVLFVMLGAKLPV